MRSLLSPREIARAVGVSESTLKRWVDAGAVATTRTPGGHRRIPFAEAVALIRRSGVPLRHPAVLGLPEVGADVVAPGAPGAGDRLYDLLAQDDVAWARGFVISLYVAGWTLPAIFDGPMRTALTRIGELWRHDGQGIFLEHRATQICLQALLQLRGMLPGPPADAPFALGAAPTGDPYLIPSQMAAVIAADAGLREHNLGPETPIDALRRAVAHHRPRLVWVAMSTTPDDPRSVAAELGDLALQLEEQGGVLAVGGRAAATLGPISAPGLHRLDSMGELAALARGLRAGAAQRA
ncbi:MAG TPA: helix-turn-helix domain-containing protein [Gemmatimonadales bacterium]|nr:helix-turn-helix domain-containing protein [Gemmatimonadales bacterium]